MAWLPGVSGCVHTETLGPSHFPFQVQLFSEDRTVRLWDVATGQMRSTFTDHTSKVSSVKFSPDGRRVASATGDVWEGYVWEQIDRPGEVKIWDVHSLQVAQ